MFANRDLLKLELDNFLAIPLIDRYDNPFVWWKEHCNTFQSVGRLARRLLCIPATSVPSERLFSKAGDIIVKKRNRLGTKRAGEVLFLMENS